jgi:hypothetical protein
VLKSRFPTKMFFKRLPRGLSYLSVATSAGSQVAPEPFLESRPERANSQTRGRV